MATAEDDMGKILLGYLVFNFIVNEAINMYFYDTYDFNDIFEKDMKNFINLCVNINGNYLFFLDDKNL